VRYLSVCSGIEAATVAWHPLGWTPVAFSEIDPFACAVLEHHYPDVPNWGDMTRFREWPDACRCVDAGDSGQGRQSRSGSAERRAGKCGADAKRGARRDRRGRGGDHSDGGVCVRCGGTDIDLLVGGTPCQSFSVAGLRAGLADPRGDLALTYLAIADRYRPTWVVWENVPGVRSSGDGRDFGSFLGALAELGYGFAYRSLDAQYAGLAQRRERVFVVGHSRDWRRAAAVLFERESLSGHPSPRREAGEVAPTVPSRRTAGGGLGTDLDCDGGLIPYAAGCLSPGAHPGGYNGQDAHNDMLVAFDARQSDVIQYGDKSGPLDTDGYSVAVAFAQNQRDEVRLMNVAGALAGEPGMKQQTYVSGGMSVRRLTPLECARLMGFPDDYLDITYRGKPAADGNKYKALGNSMAVPVVRWIGQRIDSVCQLNMESKP
jgi:DNA (cytosine-5)-methyltransferase 1